MRSNHRLTLLGAVLLITAVACNLPTLGAKTPNTRDVLQTAAAQTAEAFSTKMVTQSSRTPAPTMAGVLTTLTNAPAAATATLAATATSIPPTDVPIPCDAARFVTDVTVPDGSQFRPGDAFTKTWRIKNVGTCSWSTAYGVVFSSGDAMGGPAVTNLPGAVAPGQEVDISIAMKAPLKPGKYRGEWKLRSSSGVVFGLGGNEPFYVEIEISSGSVTPTASPTPTSTPLASQTLFSDFAASACTAQWVSGAGTLPCPGEDTDGRGFVRLLVNPKLEDGNISPSPVLETHPEWVDDGVISGRYPAIKVQSGDRFQAKVGCLYNATNCRVKFQLNYRADGGALQNLGAWSEAYEGGFTTVDVDLSALAGKNVEFILAVLADGSASQDWAVWIAPRMMR